MWPKINDRLDLFTLQSDIIADIGEYEAYYEDDVTPAQVDDEALNEIVSITDLPVMLYETDPSVTAEIDFKGQKRTYDIPYGTLYVTRKFDPSK
ncbi:hypothetical protein BRD16_09380 [Halobacteriales archaeon SW_6_65_46]|nr:MAG: hypothetical protein BRD16_09380 [Halobacteriales archaeon SW_6_65_46]